MTGAAAIRRQEYALAAAVVTVALLVVVVTLDAVRFHLPAVLGGEHARLDVHAATLLALLLVEAQVLWRVARSVLRQARLSGRLRRLPVLERRNVAGALVDVVPGSRPVAFCSGLARPRVRVTAAAVQELDPPQLAAVIAHELAHARRRDPLRMAVAHVVADGFWFMPPFRHLVARQAATADLAADAAALGAAGGSPRSLASALLAFDGPGPERIDHLVGRPLPVLPRSLLAVSGIAVAALIACAATLSLAGTDPALPAVALVLLALPAVLALRATRGGA